MEEKNYNQRLDLSCTMVDEEIDTEEIRKFSSFVFDDVFQSKEDMKEKLNKFQNNLEEECDDIEERIFVQNLISYLQWRLKERENAFKSLNIVENLQKKQSHLTTYCNKILFYIESGQHYSSYELFKELKQNDHFKQKRTRAQSVAEIGYCYSRLGPKHHDRAVNLFKEAIENIIPERNILWEFRLALTLRRQTHIFQMTTPEIYKPVESKEQAARLLYGILKTKNYDNRSINIKAKACCELGTILFRRKHLFEIIRTNIEETGKITESWCFEEAMKLCPNQYFVLEQYGRHLRYTQDLDQSKNMLERAMQLKETVFSRHHLALTLKKIVEKANPKPSFGNYPYSVEDKNQSKHDSYDFDESDMSKKFELLSVNPGQKFNNSIQDESGQCKSSFTSTFYKTSEPHSNIQTPTSLTKDNKSMFYQKRGHRKPMPSQTGSIDQKGTFISTKKSPRYVCVSPDNPLLLEAVGHLKRAIEMSKEFDGTRYDLGLIYRMLDRLDDALKCFSFITSSNCGNPSMYAMYVINAYEQQAFCKLDLLAKEDHLKKRKELQYDARKCAWKAVTIVAGVIGAIPMLKKTSQCYPTLMELLQNEDKSIRTLKDLAMLHELLNYDEEAIKFYEEIIKKESDIATVRRLVQTYIKVRDFEKAICTLLLLQRMPEAKISDKSLFVETCIKGATHSLIEDNDLEMAKITFLEAYKMIFAHLNVLTPRNDFLDILVLHSCSDDKCCHQSFITSTLETFVQINFSVNDDDCPAPRPRFGYLIETMDKSSCIFIVHHESEKDSTDDFIDRAMEIACVKHHKKILQLRTQEAEQYAPGCREIVLTCGSGDIVNTAGSKHLVKGNLFSNMLGKLSEMFLRESDDLKDGNQL